jgi:hypothetical protein
MTNDGRRRTNNPRNEEAEQQDVSVGKVPSDLDQQALTRQVSTTTRNGVPLFPRHPDAGVVTLELVNRLQELSHN